MLAELVANRGGNSQRRAFHAISYACSKAVGAINMLCLPPDWELAGKLMLLTMQASPRIKDPFLHIAFSLADEEIVSADDMGRAGLQLAQKLSGGEFQTIVAVHEVFHGRRDGHVLMNRVHPSGGPTLSLFGPRRLLEKACREIELEFGWPRDRGHFEWTELYGDTVIFRQPNPENIRVRTEMRKVGLLRPSAAQFRHEKRTGRPSLRTVFSEVDFKKLRCLVDAADSWHELEKALARSDLMIQKFAQGARIVYPDHQMFMRLSELGSGYSFSKLEARFRDVEKSNEPKKRKAPERLSALNTMVQINEPSEAEVAAYAKIDQYFVDSKGPVPASFDAREVLFEYEPQLLKHRRHANAVLKNWVWAEDDDPSVRQRDDHVECRQAWELADVDYAAEIGACKELRKFLSSSRDSVRLVDAQRLVLRQRLEARTVGFSILDWANGIGEHALATGGRPGICCIGDFDAAEVCFVVKPSDAVAVAIKHADLLVVLVHPQAPDLAARLRDLVKNRPLWAAYATDPDMKPLVDVFPELIRDDHAIAFSQLEDIIYEEPQDPMHTPRFTFA